MTIARPRAHFRDPNSRSSIFIVTRDRGAMVLVTSCIAGGALISGIAAASRPMYRLNWRTGVIGAIVVVGWVACLELLVGEQ